MKQVLAIIAGFSLLAGLCMAQTTPGNTQVPAPSAPPAVTESSPQQSILEQEVEALKAQYGATKLDENAGLEILLRPREGTQTFDVRGDARSLYNRIASAFGLKVKFDDSLPSRSVAFRLQNADFQTAIGLAARMTKTFWVPIAPDEIFVAADSAQKRREFDRMLQKTFYLRDTTTTNELSDVVNMLRTLFEIRFITQQPGNSSITVRAPQQTLHAAEALLDSMALARPQVTMQVQAFEVNHSMLRRVGLDLPLQFQMFNINSATLAALSSPDIQNLISQLLANGGLTPENAGSIAALVAQLQNQQNSLLANPVATFGGGITLFGIGIPPLTANFSLNESRVTTLQETILQASQGNAATLHVGTRFPVLTQSFSSAVNVPGVTPDIVGAVPGFTYEDLGLTLKAKPQIHGDSAVTLDLDLALKTLGSQSFNGVPVIQNRQYKGMITVKNGEPAVLAGIISNSEHRSLRGLPGIGYVPVLNRLGASEQKEDTRTELVVVITPFIVRSNNSASTIVDVPAQ
ncbi:MAG TPA: type II and III secretion system protein [Terriglobales bacterium]|nr:type II and III secretion system protein [Terriglobales bacterium]